MSTAEWGLLLGVVGTVTGTGGLVFRIYEWRMTNRPRIRVKGSACAAVPGNRFYYGDRLSPTHFSVGVVNIGKRPITVKSVGFQEVKRTFTRRRARQWLFEGIPGQLPARLAQTQDDVILYTDIGGELGEEVTSGLKVMPFCKDAEGHTHKGKTDEHFKRFVRSQKRQGEVT